MQVQQGGGNILEDSKFVATTPICGLGDDGDDDDDKVMEEAKKEIEIQDSTPPN